MAKVTSQTNVFQWCCMKKKTGKMCFAQAKYNQKRKLKKGQCMQLDRQERWLGWSTLKS